MKGDGWQQVWRVTRWIVGISGILLIVALVHHVVWRTDTFHLRVIEVRGAEVLEPDEVREALAHRVGGNLVTVDVEDLGRDVAALDWVRAVGVEKSLPGRLLVTVHEYVARLLVKIGPELLYADAAGQLFAPYDGRHVVDVPALTVPDDISDADLREAVRTALLLAHRHLRAHPDMELTAVHVDGDEGYSLEIGAIEVFLGWSPLEVEPERIATALSWLPSGRRIPAVLVAVADSDELVVRFPEGAPLEAKVTARATDEKRDEPNLQ
jgi:hypothetical protein